MWERRMCFVVTSIDVVALSVFSLFVVKARQKENRIEKQDSTKDTQRKLENIFLSVHRHNDMRAHIKSQQNATKLYPHRCQMNNEKRSASHIFRSKYDVCIKRQHIQYAFHRFISFGFFFVAFLLICAFIRYCLKFKFQLRSGCWVNRFARLLKLKWNSEKTSDERIFYLNENWNEIFMIFFLSVLLWISCDSAEW